MNKEGPTARPEVQNKLRGREKDLKIIRAARLKKLMQNADFRAWIYDHIFGACNVMGASFLGDTMTDYREGLRYIGISLTNEIQDAAPTEYVLMIQERMYEAKKEKDVQEAASTTASHEE